MCFVPGKMTASNGRSVDSVKRASSTSGSLVKGSKSVKLEMPGTSTMPITRRSSRFDDRPCQPSHPSESSSGTSRSPQ